MNTELAERVLLQVLTHPSRHAQGMWTNLERYQIFDQDRDDSECGTAACLAGWTILEALKSGMPLSGRYLPSWEEDAARLLGVELGTGFCEILYQMDNEMAVEEFAKFFGLDLEALKEKAKAQRGEML